MLRRSNFIIIIIINKQLVIIIIIKIHTCDDKAIIATLASLLQLHNSLQEGRK